MGRRNSAEEAKRDLRRARVAELYKTKTKITREIAREIDCDETTVRKDLKHIRGEWRQQAGEYIADAIAEELIKLSDLECAAWQGWHRSIGKNVRRKVARDGKEGEAKTEIVETDITGDPRFLAEIRACVQRRCRLLGLDAPENIRLLLPTLGGSVADGLSGTEKIELARAIVAELLHDRDIQNHERLGAVDADSCVDGSVAESGPLADG